MRDSGAVPWGNLRAELSQPIQVPPRERAWSGVASVAEQVDPADAKVAVHLHGEATAEADAQFAIGVDAHPAAETDHGVDSVAAHLDADTAVVVIVVVALALVTGTAHVAAPCSSLGGCRPVMQTAVSSF